MDANADAVGAQDLLFGGDVTLWEKWANSLLLRMGLRVADVDGGLASTAISAALSGPLMTSNADNAYVAHTDGPDGINRNGIGEVFLVETKTKGFSAELYSAYRFLATDIGEDARYLIQKAEEYWDWIQK